MSTQINVIVDNGGLSAKARQQTQANRWLKLERDAQSVVASRSEEAQQAKRAQQGLQVNGQPNGANAPISRYQMEEPAANRTGGNGWLALPSAYTTLPIASYDGEVLEGSRIISGAKEGTMYAYNRVANNSLPTLAGDTWVADRSYEDYLLNPFEGDELYVETSYAITTGDYTPRPPSLAKEKMTLEIIARVPKTEHTGSAGSFMQSASVLARSQYGRLEITCTSQETGTGGGASFMYISFFTVGGARLAHFYYGTSPWGDFYEGSPVAIDDDRGSMIHAALTYDGTSFNCYWKGVRLASVLKASVGITGDLMPDMVEQLINLGVSCQDSSGSVPPGAPTGPLVTPAIKAVRFTPNKLVYAGGSFPPPTALARLA